MVQVCFSIKRGCLKVFELYLEHLIGSLPVCFLPLGPWGTWFRGGKRKSSVVRIGRWSEDDSSSWLTLQLRILSSSHRDIKIRSRVLSLLLSLLVIVPLGRARLRLAAVAIFIRLSARV